MNKRFPTLSNIISARIYDNGWRDMTDEEREMYLNEIKEVLFSECKGKNTKIYQAISRMSLSNLPNNYGILDRLTTKGYTAGQDYIAEMQTIKDIIRKEC